MKTAAITWLFVALLVCWALGCDSEDPVPEPDDDPEGDCMNFHNCYGGSQWGYCMLRKGHSEQHLCSKCLSQFSDDED